MTEVVLPHSVEREPIREDLYDALDVAGALCEKISRAIQRSGPILIALGLWQFASVVQAQEDVREDAMKLMNTTHTSKN